MSGAKGNGAGARESGGQLTSKDWFGKASAGLLPGFGIALGISGLLFHALGIGESYFSLAGQFTMWIIAPVWCLILSLCFLFGSGQRAWLWLGAGCAAIWGALFLMGGFA